MVSMTAPPDLAGAHPTFGLRFPQAAGGASDAATRASRTEGGFCRARCRRGRASAHPYLTRCSRVLRMGVLEILIIHRAGGSSPE